MDKKTKILATLGPASDSMEMIEGLIKAGVNTFRLNFSHGSHEYHKETITKIRTVMKKLDIKVGVLQDISGPKVRVGELKEPFDLVKGDKIIFKKEETLGYKDEDGNYVVSINYPDIISKVKEGEFIYLYDGIIRTKVISTSPNLITEVENHGKLSSKKGVNFPNTAININIITEKDEKDIAWGVENKVDFFAISFVQNRDDMIRARELLNGYDGKLIAKIEKFDAVENIDEILEVSDGLMVARGDLGIEVPYYEVPTIQKNLIEKANRKSKLVITATQMMLSMTHNERATRAEVSDVANAVLDGTDAVMLSEESAVGENPILVVETMANIIKEIEKIYPFDKHDKLGYEDKFDIIQSSALQLADNLNAAGILALTSSGRSAVKMSRLRPKTPIYAFGHKGSILSSLSLCWGVKPISKIKEDHVSKMFQSMLKILEERGMLDKEGPYITTVGYPVGEPGTTNMIKILTKSEIEYYYNLK